MAEYIEKEKAARILRQEAAAHYPTAFHVGLYAAARAIESIPAADVWPVARGKWIASGDGYHWTYNCSICGWKDGYPFNERHNFCPNCGADMRETEDEKA